MRRELRDFISHARWFGGKGRAFEVTGSRRLRLPGAPSVGPEGPWVAVELVELAYADGGTDLYQVPVSYYATEHPDLEHARIGHWDDEELGEVHAYDALHDHAATPVWLHAFAVDHTDGVRFRRVGDAEIDVTARSTLLTGEQSNSSVAFGNASLMKLFRRVTPGRNPDIEILEALTEAGNPHIAALYGYVETTAPDDDGEVLQLGILQQFLTTASDGWELALASLRNLFADGETHADEAGGDFAAEARRLGISVAEMHESLASAFPTESWGEEDLSRVAEAMEQRLADAIEVVPELAAHADALRSRFDALRHASTGRAVTATRVHGDLHLGQTLRTVRNWKIIDFEGEPAKSLTERRRPDSPWRDVAGMLRSFDYAAELSRLDHEQATGDVDEHDAGQAREWAERNVEAFLDGYTGAAGGEVDQALLLAYQTDKAVYEAVYEARNRPAWLPIPMAALARLADES